MHKSQDQLDSELKAAAQKVAVSTHYYHYKNPEKLYTVLGLAITESNDEVCVIYQAQYGKKIIFVRALTSWLEIVEVNGKKVSRFTAAS